LQRAARKPVSSLKGPKMSKSETIVAVFAEHQSAEAAIKKLAENGFDIKNLSLVGKGYHSDEKVIGFYNTGDRVKFWGSRGAFWGGFWGLFFGGLFITIPLVGPVAVLGYLGAIIISAVENAVLVGGLSAIGAALFSIGIPKDSVLQYEADVKADGFLVMARGTPAIILRAKEMLREINPTRLDVHAADEAAQPAEPHVASVA
jgi:hypothetical protein